MASQERLWCLSAFYCRPQRFWAKKPRLAIAASGKTRGVIAGPFSAISIKVIPMTDDRDAGRAPPDQPAAGISFAAVVDSCCNLGSE
jgi:hypothetical protein